MMNDSTRWLARLLAAVSVLAALVLPPTVAAQAGATPAGVDKVKTLRGEGAVNTADIDIGDVFKVERDRP